MPGAGSLLEAELLGVWWCHCLYGRQGESVPPPGEPPLAICPAYQEEEVAGRCWVSGGGEGPMGLSRREGQTGGGA